MAKMPAAFKANAMKKKAGAKKKSGSGELPPFIKDKAKSKDKDKSKDKKGLPAAFKAKMGKKK